MAAIDILLVGGWLMGPKFARVPTGPQPPPGWMRAILMVGQIALPLLAVLVVYRLLIRPWRQDRRITVDGLICVAALFVSIWDPLSSGPQPWFAYNSYLLNRGLPLSSLPGWLSLNEPGQTLAWPFPLVPALYVVVIPLAAMAGSAIMRRVARLYPRLPALGLVGVSAVVMLAFEIVFEGVVFLPMGFWTYPGGWWPITFGGHYYQLPANELLHATVVYTGLTAFRYFTNDRGQTVAERGVEQIPAGEVKRAAMRLLAVIAVIHLMIFTAYHIPAMGWAVNSRPWPEDVTRRSYFQNQCGPLLDRACPGPGVPIARPGSGYLDWEGRYQSPR